MAKPVEEKKPWDIKVRYLDRLTPKERTIFFKHLATMIEAGVPLEKGLLAIHKQAQTKSFHRILHLILHDLGSGEDLSSTLKKMPHVFNELVVNLVAVGEKTGTLAEALRRIGEHFEKVAELRKKILSALVYPFIVIAGTIGTVAYLVFVLLPQITPLFASLDVELPMSTVFVLGAAEFLAKYGVMLSVGAVVLAIGFFSMRIEKMRYAVHSVLLYIPIVSTLIKKTQVARFSQMLGVLLASGVNIVEAFKIASRALEHPVYRRSLQKIGDSIQEGENIGKYLQQHPELFSPLVTQMISVGEETARLDESFLSVAAFTEQEIDEAIKVLTTLLEPALMIVIGGIVGFVAIAVITPIYQLTSGIGV